MLEQLGFLALGSVMTVAGYFGQRWIRKDHVTEKFSRAKLVLEVMEKMRAQGVDADALEAFEASYQMREIHRDMEDRIAMELTKADLEEFESAMTQFDMNAASFRTFERADLRLKHTCDKLVQSLGPGEDAIAEAAQSAWVEFRDRQADFAASFVSGGSMYPTQRAFALYQLTVDRIAALENEIAHRRSLFGSD